MAWNIFNRTPTPLPLGAYGTIPGNSTDSIVLEESDYQKIKHLLSEGALEAEKIGEDIVHGTEKMFGFNQSGSVAAKDSVSAAGSGGYNYGAAAEKTGIVEDISNQGGSSSISGGASTNNPPSTQTSMPSGVAETINSGKASVPGGKDSVIGNNASILGAMFDKTDSVSSSPVSLSGANNSTNSGKVSIFGGVDSVLGNVSVGSTSASLHGDNSIGGATSVPGSNAKTDTASTTGSKQ